VVIGDPGVRPDRGVFARSLPEVSNYDVAAVFPGTLPSWPSRSMIRSAT
jgi:hypothetical protein